MYYFMYFIWIHYEKMAETFWLQLVVSKGKNTKI